MEHTHDFTQLSDFERHVCCFDIRECELDSPTHKRPGYNRSQGDTAGGQWYSGITWFLVSIQQCVLVPRLVISIREYSHQLTGPESTTIDLSTVAFASNRHIGSALT